MTSSPQDPATWLCLSCGDVQVLDDDLDRWLGACGACGDTHPPVPAAQVSVELTVHELRILVIWAERFAAVGTERMRQVLYGIADRLSLQLGAGAPALTLLGEMAEMRSHADAATPAVLAEADQPDDPPPGGGSS